MNKIAQLLKTSAVLSLLLWAPLLALAGHIHERPATTDVHLTRSESREFTVGANTKLYVQNKYGEIILHPWNQSKVKIEVSVNGYGKTQELAEKVLERIFIDFNEHYGTVSATTVFDKPSSTIKEFWRGLTEDAKAILSRNKLEVDYDIYLPANINIELDNKFGDVYLGDLGGGVQVRLAHGALKSGKLSGDGRFFLNFSNTDLQELGDASIEIKGGSLDIAKAGNIDLNTAISEVFIGEMQELRLNSRNDKIKIGKMHSVSGKTFFTRLNIDRLQGSMALEANYGSIDVKELPATFEEISLSTTATDVWMRVAKDCSFLADITAQPQHLTVPAQFNLQATAVGEKGQYMNSKGNIGGLPKGKLYMNAKGGKIRIEYF